MKEKVETLKKELLEKLENVKNLKELELLKAEYMGKSGIITNLQSGIKEVPNEEKKEYGMNVNILRTAFNENYEEKLNKSVSNLDEFLSSVEEINNKKVIIAKTENYDMNVLKGIIDNLMVKLGEGLVFISKI